MDWWNELPIPAKNAQVLKSDNPTRDPDTLTGSEIEKLYGKVQS